MNRCVKWFAVILFGVLVSACYLEGDLESLRPKKPIPPVQYTVSFDANGGSGVGPAAQTVAAGFVITLPNQGGLFKDDYTFGGWSTEAAGEGINYNAGDFCTVSENIILYARWIPAGTEFTVSFKSNGGSAVSDQIVIAGNTATRPEDPIRDGFFLEGWYRDSGLNNRYDFARPVTEGFTLYARWNKIPEDLRLVAFNSNGGSFVSPQLVVAGSTASRPDNPRRSGSGYIFENWYIDEGLSAEYDFAAPVNDNVTLYAKWAPYNVILIDGGGHEAGYDYLIDALDAITTTGLYTVEIYADQTSFAPYTLSIEGTDITLTAPVRPIEVQLSDTGSLFTIEDGVSLTLEEGVTLRGRDDNDASLVYVDGGGTFIMNGGEISGNHNNNYGGGVFVDGGTFTMKDGTISENTAASGGGGVDVWDSTFTMSGGKISGNAATSDHGGGGGVHVNYNSTFTMTGGEISNNTASGSDAAGGGGGGVFVGGANTIFTMSGGEISGNKAIEEGGGVYVHGTFTMNNGEISGNTAYDGGGVCVRGTFTMINGKIINNTAGYGGGVLVECGNGGTFNLGGTAVIKDNTKDGTANNVYLPYFNDPNFTLVSYITLIEDSPPAPGMEVWVQTATPSGVIVNEGATGYANGVRHQKVIVSLADTVHQIWGRG